MQLELKQINKSFGTNHVLKDVSFQVRGGTAFGLLGRNGSGKTTTIRIIMDIFGADSGQVTIDGVPNTKAKVKIGYLPEERGLYPKRTVSEQMIYLGELRGMSARDAKESGERLLNKLDAIQYNKKRLDTLSKGNQQKIQLAIALINNPDIVILDEPFSGLDPVNAKLLKDLVSELVAQNKTVLFSSHQMSNVEEFCDDVCIINYGDIVLNGNLKQIKKTYPRNRILLIPEDEAVEKLSRDLLSNSAFGKVIKEVTTAKNGCIVTLSEPEAKQALFHALSTTSIQIDEFSVMEPTLEEIFVEKAGDINEAV